MSYNKTVLRQAQKNIFSSQYLLSFILLDYRQSEYLHTTFSDSIKSFKVQYFFAGIFYSTLILIDFRHSRHIYALLNCFNLIS